MEIPRNDDDLAPLEVNSRDVDSPGDVLQVHVKTGIALLTHFLDRGLYSGHVFATSNLNHRDLDVGHWNSIDKARPHKMTECLINPTNAELFDKGSCVSLFFYGLQSTNLTEDQQSTVAMQTAMCLYDYSKGGGTKTPDDDGGLDYVYAANIGACILTGTQFERCLRFFNRKWTCKNGTARDPAKPPSISEVTQFCLLFKDQDIGTASGWSSFISNFGLESIFAVMDDTSLEKQHEYFGIILRSLVPMRVGANDGQHRTSLIGLFLTGCYDLKNALPLKRGIYKDSELGRRYNGQYGKMNQLFADLNILIARNKGE